MRTSFITLFCLWFVFTALADGVSQGRVRVRLGRYLRFVYDVFGLQNRWTHFASVRKPTDRLGVVLDFADGVQRDFVLRPPLASSRTLDKLASHRMRKFELAVLSDPHPVILLGLLRHVVGRLSADDRARVRTIRLQRIITRLPVMTDANAAAATEFEDVAVWNCSEWLSGTEPHGLDVRRFAECHVDTSRVRTSEGMQHW